MLYLLLRHLQSSPAGVDKETKSTPPPPPSVRKEEEKATRSAPLAVTAVRLFFHICVVLLAAQRALLAVQHALLAVQHALEESNTLSTAVG
jgi:hypothetical protein